MTLRHLPSPSMSSSQSSPSPSLSVSLWEGFSTVLQLSQASPWRSLSLFFWSTLGTSQQLSWDTQTRASWESYDPVHKISSLTKACNYISDMWKCVRTSMLIRPSLSASSSQASPIPSLSASSWPEFGTNTQLSCKRQRKKHTFVFNASEKIDLFAVSIDRCCFIN